MKCFDRARIQSLQQHFDRLYEGIGLHCMERMQMMVGRYGVGTDITQPESLWSHKDALLITYGDMVSDPEEPPLLTLRNFLTTHLAGAINAVHILPFFPYSSDDGFSVIDYHEVNPDLGNWEHIEAIARDFRVMADLVLNHCSRRHQWFRDYVAGISPGRHYFIEVDPQADLSAVVRPRSLPLLTFTQTRNGGRHVWTTFSEDQIDLNFANPDVLFEFLDILFYYIFRGIRIIRLDAIAYLWKEIGTPCIHLPQTHTIVKILRNVVDIVAPGVIIVTETNVPHKENLSYLGNGDEAHAAYQFTLPPLLLHALQTGTGRHLTEWAASLPDLPAGQTFINFTASHDGIGIRPLEGILPRADRDALAEAVLKRGGHVSTRKNADGSESPYELNITYFDALANPDNPEDPHHVDRYLCSQAIPLALRGIPAIYFNNLIAARNNTAGVEETGRPRAINRRKWTMAELDATLSNKSSVPATVFRKYTRLLRLRAQHPAFHPDGAQKILDLGDSLFAVQRTSPDGRETIVAVSNLTSRTVSLKLDGRIPAIAEKPTDILRPRNFGANGRTLSLSPYKTAWLTAAPDE